MNDIFGALSKNICKNISEAMTEKTNILNEIKNTLSNELNNLTKSTPIHADTKKVYLKFSNLTTSSMLDSEKHPLTVTVELMVDEKKANIKTITLLDNSPFESSSPFENPPNLPSTLEAKNFSIDITEIFEQNILADGIITIYDFETDPGF